MASSRFLTARRRLLTTAGAAGVLALASGACAQTINATTPADISTAIGDANTGGSPIVLTTSAVDLTGASLPTLTTGVLQFGQVTSSPGQIGQVSGG